MEYSPQKFADWVRDTRTALGLSQPEIARRGGPSAGWIGQLEAGIRTDKPKVETLRKIAKGLGVAEREVFAAAGMEYPGDNTPGIVNALGVTIDSLMDTNGVDLEQLADVSGVSIGLIDSLIHRTAEHVPDDRTLEAIERGLGVTSNVLVKIARPARHRGSSNTTSKPVIVSRDQKETGEGKNIKKIGNHDGIMVSGNQAIELQPNVSMISDATGNLEFKFLVKMPANHVRLPVFGPVSCGPMQEFSISDAPDFLELPRVMADGADAVFVVTGDCLSARNIKDGYYVLVSKFDGDRPLDGTIVVVESEGTYSAKIYRSNVIGEYLESHEAGGDPQPHKFPDGTRLVGKVIWFFGKP